MSFYLDKKIVANSANAMAQHNQIMNMRTAWNNVESNIGNMYGSQYNAAARLPQDAYREFDKAIKTVMAGDEGGNIVSVLPNKSSPLGKIVLEYAQASDSGSAQTTTFGRQAHQIDNASYEYDNALMQIHDDGFGRQWLEVEGMRTEDFDGLIDDQKNSVRAVKRAMYDHILNGVTGSKYKDASAYGMKNSPNTQSLDLDADGVGVDLTDGSATFSDFEAAIVAALKALQGSANNVGMDITFAFSSDIWFNALRTGTPDTNYTTILEACRRIPGVKDIIKTNGTQLSGNEFLAWANSDEYIEIKTAMAVNTQPVIRQMFNDPFNFVTWGSCGLLIKADTAGRSGVLYAREIA